MKIDVYSVMRNEIRILPYFLRHYERLADRIFVWDDRSDDGTTEALRAHPKVVLLPLDRHGADDNYYIAHLWPQYRTISRGHADWAICVDADEFVYHPDLVAELKRCRDAGKRKISCRGFAMWSPAFPTTAGQIYDEVKLGSPCRRSTKTVVFDPEIHIRWTQGRHKSWPSRQHPTWTDTGIKLLHFRFLGMEYHLLRNRKNCVNMGVTWDSFAKYNLPDGSRTIPESWYAGEFSGLERVVD